jgi:hypothetical protein
MIDNFEKILPLLEFPKPGDSFYFIQILQRKKDHAGVRIGGSNNNSRLIKTYHINSVEKFLIHKEEMIKMAELFDARIGINLNPRSYEKTAFQLLSKISHQMENKNFYDVRKAYDSVCGNYHSEMDKRWLVDIDNDMQYDMAGRIKYITDTIIELQEQITNREYVILATIPSKNGCHLITNPFNLQKFHDQIKGVEVHKNNPTNLYIP